MNYLLDTSILMRLANASDAQHTLTIKAIAILRRQGHELCITAQNLIEFRSGATRPIANNGLGASPVAAAQEAAKFEANFRFIAETPQVYPTWKTLADTLGVTGKQVHDTRLVAVCHVHGITHLLTFNVRHFLRFQTLGPGLAVVDPSTV